MRTMSMSISCLRSSEKTKPKPDVAKGDFNILKRCRTWYNKKLTFVLTEACVEPDMRCIRYSPAQQGDQTREVIGLEVNLGKDKSERLVVQPPT